MEKYNIKITAKNINQFEYIEKLLKKLPDNVLNQIETVEVGTVGIKCVIKYLHKETQTLIIPKNVTQISDFGNYTGIYCGKYFFKVTGELYKKKINYVFI